MNGQFTVSGDALKSPKLFTTNTVSINYQMYEIDWDKVQTLDDMKRLMKEMNPTFSLLYPEQCECLDLLKKLP